MRNETDVNVAARAQMAANNGSSPTVELQIKPDSPFPFLETIVTVAKRYPHAALAAMISIAAVVISAITVLSVSVIGGMFLMYGEMRQNTATMRENQSTMVQILDKQQTIETRQINDGNILRAYEAANGKRSEFMVGLMTPDKQRLINEYDKAHPLPIVPNQEN